jgi:hypothetical protein
METYFITVSNLEHQYIAEDLKSESKGLQYSLTTFFVVHVVQPRNICKRADETKVTTHTYEHALENTRTHLLYRHSRRW